MKKTKLLVVSDDIRNPTGVGIQCNKLLTGLNKKGVYDIVEIAGSLQPTAPQPVMFNGIKLYPASDSYGNANLLRSVHKAERPDIVLFFSDPRFFEYAFMMDNEIRATSKLVFYHTWDAPPFPRYNLPWYSACDEIVMLSKFSHDLLTEGGVKCSCIQHGMDPSEFYPLSDEQRAEERKRILAPTGRTDIDFVIFWNNRNMLRKRGADLIVIFKKFFKTHPKSLLFLHTHPRDPMGTDLGAVIEEVNVGSDNPLIMMSSQPVSSQVLNVMYNIADVTVNIAFNEGFGLCVAESLCAGTPVIATKTGGMTEQLTDGDHVFGELLDPAASSLYGYSTTPYIYADYVSEDQVLQALTTAYENKDNLPKIGEAGRDHIIKNFHIESTVDKWHDLLQHVVETPSKFKKWKLL